MPKQSGTMKKRPRSPPRYKVEESSNHNLEETASEEEVVERRPKHRQDARVVTPKGKGKARI